MTDTKNLYDAVIIGGGPAGLTAALYLGRARYRVLVLEKDRFGGQITITNEVVNYPGVLAASGEELAGTMRQQAANFGAEFKMAEVTGLEMGGDVKTVHTTKGDVQALSVLLASGASPRHVGFDGEEDYQGHGVAYCATCDGEFFTGKEVLVVGGGFAAAEDKETADVVILNSCTVTAESDRKVRQIFRRAKKDNPDAVMVLTGCMAQAFPEDARRLEEADIILGTSNRKRLVPDLLAFLSARQRIIDIAPHTNDEKFENLNVENFTGRTRAFVKIEDGCNRFCSYCIIPYARGRVRSKPLEDLKAELAGLGANGYKEVVLTGINLSAYGQEFGLHLCDAIEAACATPGIERVRLGSLEPEQLSEDVIRRMAKQKKLCPQFHLSLQSGCDATLKRMNRHYTADEYRTIVRNLRAAFENAAITTDIMVGFAGETDEEFAKSLAFAEEIAFAKVHVFAYSRRPGTRAYDMGDQLTNAVKEARSHEMIRVTTATQQAFFKAQIGRTEEVLFEREIQKGVWEGYSMNYTPVAVASGTSLAGEIRSVRIESCTDTHCMGAVL